MTVTPERVLACPMEPETNDAKASTIREYLIKLLATFWDQTEGFSSKRPFGNSSWQGEIEVALIKADLIAGSFDSDGFMDDADSDEADRLVAGAIMSLSETDPVVAKPPPPGHTSKPSVFDADPAEFTKSVDYNPPPTAHIQAGCIEEIDLNGEPAVYVGSDSVSAVSAEWLGTERWYATAYSGEHRERGHIVGPPRESKEEATADARRVATRLWGPVA